MRQSKYTFVTEDKIRINKGDEVYWLKVKDGNIYEPLFSFGQLNWNLKQERSKDDCYKWFKFENNLKTYINKIGAEN